MQALVVFVVLLGAQPALSQTRPIISEVFQSAVEIHVTTAGGGEAWGVGKMTFDQPNGLALESFRFHRGPSYEVITRYDLGQVFEVDPPTCEVTEVTGTMPTTWGWIAQAKQGDTEVIDGITVVFWVSTGSLGTFKRVGVTLEDSTTPVFYEIITPEQTTRLQFLNWKTTFKNKPNLFTPPRRCLR